MTVRLWVVLVAAVAACAAAAPAGAARPLQTAVFDPRNFNDESHQAVSFARTKAAGASMARVTLFWNSVATRGEPAGDPTDPSHPQYDWAWFDRLIRTSVAHGVEPFVEVIYAPPWAGGGENGIVRPDPAKFGQFALAAARRFSGSYSPLPGVMPPLPRVRYWQAWGEPNRDYFLMPQFEGGRIASALHYRELLYRFAAAVRAANPTNQVIAGALSPLARQGKPAPLAFMRELLCLTRSLRRSCDLRGRPVPFDVWSHHAYTTGGPTHKAPGRDDVSLGDLPKLRRTLHAALRLGQTTRRIVPLWVTEFSWDSNPPDPRAVPAALHRRWVSEALFRMWANGVTLATWWRIQDDPLSASPYQSGFYTVGGRAKSSLKAFRFPLVAFPGRGGIYVWGRTPAGRRGRVVLQAKSGRRWRRLGVMQTNRYGIFTRRVRTSSRRGSVRALFRRESSVPFSLAYHRDRSLNPFGCGGVIGC